MFNRLSLRIKITLISTTILSLVSIVLTVFNANSGFSTVMREITLDNDSGSYIDNGYEEMQYQSEISM